MSSFGVQMSYASIDRGDGSDPRADARAILRRLRVPAGISDGETPWADAQQEAVVTIPVADDGRVLTLNEADVVETTLTAAALREAFTDAGLTLWLHTDDGCCDHDDDDDADDEAGVSIGAEAERSENEAAEPDSPSSEADGFDVDEFDERPLQIAVFSHRGPFSARMIAQLNGLEVEHLEHGSWSLLRFESADPTTAGVATKAEMPVVELNRVDGGSSWFEVTTSGGVHQFWPDAERGTVPALDLDAISVPETAEICRRLLRDGDGSREELDAIAAHSRLDAAAAHRALQPESLGGTSGERARQEAFLAAFGIPAELIEAAFGDTALDVRRFAPEGWGALIGETLIDGTPAMTPLTRRDRPFARLVQVSRRRPLLAAALCVGELALGVAASRRAGASRVVGILLIIDAVAELALTAVRTRRR